VGRGGVFSLGSKSRDASQHPHGRVYRGRIVALNGSRHVASVRSSEGHGLSLQVALAVDAGAGTSAGRSPLLLPERRWRMSIQQVQAVRLPRLLNGIPIKATCVYRASEIHSELPTGHGRRHKRRDAAGLLESIEEAGLYGRGAPRFPPRPRCVRSPKNDVEQSSWPTGRRASRKSQGQAAAGGAAHLVLDGGSLAPRQSAPASSSSVSHVCERCARHSHPGLEGA